MNFTRRRFMQLTGAAVAVEAAFATSCQDAEVFRGPTQWRVHFNLSNFAAGEAFAYHNFAGRTPLVAHDAGSVAVAKETAPFLRHIPDSAFTHYVDADIPASLVSTSYVTRAVTLDGGTHDLLVHMQDHIPATTLAATSDVPRHYHPGARRTLLALGGGALGVDEPAGCSHAAGPDDGFRCADGTDAVSPGDCLDQYVDTVLSLLKKHPSLIKLDPSVHLTMESLLLGGGGTDGEALRGQVIQLAVLLMGYETCAGGWTELQKYKRYEDNLTDYLIDGQPAYGFGIKPAVMTELVEPASSFIDACRNLPAFEDVIWTHETAPGVAPAPAQPLPGATGPTVEIHPKSADGIGVEATLTDFGDGGLKVTAKNSRLRHVGIYYRFRDADGNAIKLSALDEIFQDKADDTHVSGGMLSPSLLIVDVAEKDVSKTIATSWPEAASYVDFVFGGPGHGADSEYANKGIVWSSLLEIAVPTALCIGGVAVGANKAFITLMEDCEAKLAVGACGGFLLTGEAGFDCGMSGGNPWAILADFANTLAPMLIDTGLSAVVAKYMGESSLATAVPLVRVVVQIGTIGLYLGRMGRTISDWVKSSKESTFTLSIPYRATVTVHHDPRDTSFPKQAASYEIKRIYQNMSHVDTSTLRSLGAPEDWKDPLSYSFESVPSGGQVKYVAQLVTSDGWVAAQGQTDWMENSQAVASAPTIVLMNNLVPLTKRTSYGLAFVAERDTAYRWKKTSIKPPGTLASLSSANGHISELGGLTLDQKHGLLGYDWKASGTGLGSCTNPAGSGAQLHVFQTLDTFGAPDAHRIFPSCAFLEPAMLAYDFLPSQFLIKFWITPSVIDRLSADKSITLSAATLAGLRKMAIAEATAVDLHDGATDPAGVYKGQQVFVNAISAHLGAPPDRAVLGKILDYANKTWSLTPDDKPIPDPGTITLANFVVDPRQATDGAPYYFVFDIAPSADASHTLPPIGSTSAVTRGKLLHRPTAVTLTTSKQLVAVNWELDLVESLDLGAPLRKYEEAPPAVVRAGKGSEPGAGTVLGPMAVAGTYDGNVLVLESRGEHHRIQAFTGTFASAAIFLDGAGNPTPYVTLDTGGVAMQFLDLAVESRGYMYVLGYVNSGLAISDFRLRIYDPLGRLLAITEGVNAGRIAVDMWRTLYTLNYSVMPSSSMVEPSLGIWLPSDPGTP